MAQDNASRDNCSWASQVESFKQAIQIASSTYSVPDTVWAQQCILGACLFHQSTQFLDGLTTRHFDGENALIYEAVKKAEGFEGSVDLVAVLGELPTNYHEFVKDLVTMDSPQSNFGKVNISNCRQLIFEAEIVHRRIAAAYEIMTAPDLGIAIKNVSLHGMKSKVSQGIEITASTKLPRNPYLLKFKGTPMFQCGNFYTLMGKQKSAKSHAFAVWLAAFLGGHSNGFSCLELGVRVLYIDTEQNLNDVQGIIQTSNHLMNVDLLDVNSRLRVVSVAQNDYEDILPIIRENIESFKPKVVFVDSFGGMIRDCNDKLAPVLVKDIRQLAQQSDVAIIGIMHTTPTQEKVKALGVFGSELQRWGGGSFLCEKQDDGMFRLSAYESRKMPIGDFYYRLDTVVSTPDGELHQCNYETLYDEVTDMGYNLNDVDVYAVPRGIDTQELNSIRDEKKEAEQVVKDRRDFYELNPKFAYLYPVGQNKEYKPSSLKEKYVETYYREESAQHDSLLRKAARKIDRAKELGILTLDKESGCIRYVEKNN